MMRYINTRLLLLLLLLLLLAFTETSTVICVAIIGYGAEVGSSTSVKLQHQFQSP